LIAGSHVDLKEFFSMTNFARAVLPAAGGRPGVRRRPARAPKVPIVIPKAGARVQAEESFK
jgi:hypothetical protein